MDNDSEDEFVHRLLLMPAGQQGDEFEDDSELLACIGLVCYGLEEARRHSVLRRSSHSLYLTCSDLLPDSPTDTRFHIVVELNSAGHMFSYWLFLLNGM